MNNPEGQPDLVSAPKTIAQIQAEFQRIKALADKKKQDWEAEKTALAVEIVDMAEGNKKIAKPDSMSGDAYRRSFGANRADIVRSKDELAKFDADYQAQMGEIATLRDELKTSQQGADPEMHSEYEQMLGNLDVQEAQLQDVSDEIRSNIQASVQELEKRGQSVSDKFEKFHAEQGDAAKEPVAFATDTVLFSQKEHAGKDLEGKKPEIAEAVQEELHVRKSYEYCKSVLSLLEKDLPSAEAVLASVHSEVDTVFQQSQIDFEEFEKELDGSVGAEVQKKKGLIKIGKDAVGKWFGNAKIEAGKIASQELGALKKAKENRLGEIIAPFYTTIARISYEVDGGPMKAKFSPMLVSSNLRNIEEWKESAQKNPRIFGEVQSTLTEYEIRLQKFQDEMDLVISSEQPRRKAMNDIYNKVSKKVNALFA